MIVDTSALIAIARGEPEAGVFAAILSEADDTRISAGSMLEAGLVIDGFGDPVLNREFETVLQSAQLTIEPFSASQAELARQAYRDFGKGSGHPAGLNFGDCFAYALAFESGEPLLFKGQDFVHTGIAVAHDSQA